MSETPCNAAKQPTPASLLVNHSARDHRCAECTLTGALQDANETIRLLRGEVARLSADLTRARAALYDESEAHAIADRRAARLSAQLAAMESA